MSPQDKHLIHYNTLLSESKRYGETNDCSVIAIAIIHELSYNAAHKLCYDYGRKARRGFYTKKVILSLGKNEPEQVIKQSNGSMYTIKTIPNALPFGKFFVFTQGHILAMIDGNIYDWTEDRKHRVTSIIEIDKTELMDLI